MCKLTLDHDLLRGGNGGDGGVAVSIDKLRLRRASYMVAAFGVLALVVTGPLDRLLLGVFICIGLGLGWINAQLTLRSITSISRAGAAAAVAEGAGGTEGPSKQMMALSTAGRLVVLTVLAIVVAFLTRPDGIGIFFGLALFQVVLVLHTVIPEWKGLRQQS